MGGRFEPYEMLEGSVVWVESDACLWTGRCLFLALQASAGVLNQMQAARESQKAWVMWEKLARLHSGSVAGLDDALGKTCQAWAVVVQSQDDEGLNKHLSWPPGGKWPQPPDVAVYLKTKRALNQLELNASDDDECWQTRSYALNVPLDWWTFIVAYLILCFLSICQYNNSKSNKTHQIFGPVAVFQHVKHERALFILQLFSTGCFWLCVEIEKLSRRYDSLFAFMLFQGCSCLFANSLPSEWERGWSGTLHFISLHSLFILY